SIATTKSKAPASASPASNATRAEPRRAARAANGMHSGPLQLTVTALGGIPNVEPGADLAALLIAALERHKLFPQRFDVLVVTQKIVSKAEGRYLDLDRIEPSQRAQQLAKITGKDPRLVAAVLSQAEDVLRAKTNVLIVATR